MQRSNERQIALPAKTNELDRLIDFLSEFLREHGFDAKSITQTSIAAEEIFTNINNYAQLTDAQSVTVNVFMEEDCAVMSFADGGTPFDPLTQKTPDTSLPIEQRAAGGLGIFMIQKLVSSARYSREDGLNILTITKQKTTEAN